MKQRSSSTDRARRLRRERTNAEARLWVALRNRQVGGHKFRRQRPVDGAFPDFVCVERRLAVEVDGGQHSGSMADMKRTTRLNAQGFRVVRFWNNEVLANIEGALTEILKAIEEQ